MKSMTLHEFMSVLSRFRQGCHFEQYDLPFEEFLPAEEEMRFVLPKVVQLDTGAFATLRASIDMHLAVLLNRFARRMANAAVQLNNDDLVCVALVGVSLDNDLLDDRDVYGTGALIIDSLSRRNLDASTLFTRYLSLATENRRALLTRQLKTAPSYMRSLRSMGFGVVESGAFFKYVDQLFESPVHIDTKAVDNAIRQLENGEAQGEERGKT